MNRREVLILATASNRIRDDGRSPSRHGPVVLIGAAFLAAALLRAEPAKAMCGGNIFVTCPPSAQAASANAAKAKREKRLEAVRAKKSHARPERR